MNQTAVSGFDYRAQSALTQSRREWRDEVERVEAAGGCMKRIGGDLTAFDKHGRMLFEIYDKDGGDTK